MLGKTMKVFLSWSGEPSKSLAECFRRWLPAVLQAVRPYFSPDDITKGARWSPEIAKELEECKVGVIFLTSQNLAAPWIMFEAGALSKSLGKSNVCPLLFRLEASDIQGPLIQFQAAKFDKEEVKRVVNMMNSLLNEAALATDVLDGVFEMWWPQLNEQVERVLTGQRQTRTTEVRSERELLEEVLNLTRALSLSNSRDKTPKALNSGPVIELIEKLTHLSSDIKNTGIFDTQRLLLLGVTDTLGALLLRLDGAEVSLKATDEMIRRIRADLKSAPTLKIKGAEDDDVPF